MKLRLTHSLTFFQSENECGVKTKEKKTEEEEEEREDER